jgi:hypothetical protein
MYSRRHYLPEKETGNVREKQRFQSSEACYKIHSCLDSIVRTGDETRFFCISLIYRLAADL